MPGEFLKDISEAPSPSHADARVPPSPTRGEGYEAPLSNPSPLVGEGGTRSEALGG